MGRGEGKITLGCDTRPGRHSADSTSAICLRPSVRPIHPSIHSRHSHTRGSKKRKGKEKKKKGKGKMRSNEEAKGEEGRKKKEGNPLSFPCPFLSLCRRLRNFSLRLRLSSDIPPTRLPSCIHPSVSSGRESNPKGERISCSPLPPVAQCNTRRPPVFRSFQSLVPSRHLENNPSGWKCGGM